jgi:hypothetical protein
LGRNGRPRRISRDSFTLGNGLAQRRPVRNLAFNQHPAPPIVLCYDLAQPRRWRTRGIDVGARSV